MSNDLAIISEALEQAIEDKIKEATLMLHREVVDILSGGRSGREYRIPATKSQKASHAKKVEKAKSKGKQPPAPPKGGVYTASAPGEAPAVRLGQLRQKYVFRFKGKGMKTVGTVGNPLKYSVYLEKGTEVNGEERIAPRPHLSVAFDRIRPRMIELFKDLL